MLIVLEVVYDIKIHQKNVKNPLLNKELGMKLHGEAEAFVVPDNEKRVCEFVALWTKASTQKMT